MSNENPKGLYVDYSGLHTNEPGVLGNQQKTLVEAEGWHFLHPLYSHHAKNDHGQVQAQEGFTLTGTLLDAATRIRDWRNLHGNLPVVIGGVGFGGEVALQVATDPDNMVNGLVLLNPSFNIIDTYVEKLLSKSLPWLPRKWYGLAQYLIWARYAYLQRFKYYVDKANGERMHHTMPQSLLRDLRNYDVMRRVRYAKLPIYAATPNPAQEGFLASVQLCYKFCDAVRFVHAKWPPFEEYGQSNLGHGGNHLLTDSNKLFIRTLLQRATAHHHQQQQKLAEVGAALSAVNAD